MCGILLHNDTATPLSRIIVVWCVLVRFTGGRKAPSTSGILIGDDRDTLPDGVVRECGGCRPFGCNHGAMLGRNYFSGTLPFLGPILVIHCTRSRTRSSCRRRCLFILLIIPEGFPFLFPIVLFPFRVRQVGRIGWGQQR